MTPSRDVLDAEVRRAGELFVSGASLPEQVFRIHPARYCILEFELLWTRRFFECLSESAKILDSGGMTLLVRSPDPIDYYYHHFGVFPVFRFEAAASVADYTRVTNADPGGSAADAVIFRSDVVQLFPATGSWALHADRESGIAILAAEERAMSTIRGRLGSMCLSPETVGMILDANGLEEGVLERYGERAE